MAGAPSHQRGLETAPTDPPPRNNSTATTRNNHQGPGSTTRGNSTTCARPRPDPNERTEPQPLPPNERTISRDSPTTLDNSHLGPTDQGLSTPTPFVGWGSALRSAPRPAPFLAPPSFETLPEKPRRGAFLSPGRVTPRIRQSGEDAPPPPPFSLSTTREGRFGREIFARAFWAGDLGGRYLSGSFGREMPLRTLVAAATPLLSSVPRRS